MFYFSALIASPDLIQSSSAIRKRDPYPISYLAFFHRARAIMAEEAAAEALLGLRCPLPRNIHRGSERTSESDDIEDNVSSGRGASVDSQRTTVADNGKAFTAAGCRSNTVGSDMSANRGTSANPSDVDTSEMNPKNVPREVFEPTATYSTHAVVDIV